MAADAHQWILIQQGLQDLLHYLDDFLFVKPPGAPSMPLETAVVTCEALGVPVTLDKQKGPASTITFPEDAGSLLRKVPKSNY